MAVAFDLDYREDTWDTVEEASLYLSLAAEKADLVLGTRDEFDVMEHLLHTGNQDDAKSAAWLLEKGVSVVSIKKGKKVPMFLRRKEKPWVASIQHRC